jgi:predicted DNA-binding transcriptional regulator YafY
MSASGKFKRYVLILEKVRYRPTFQDLSDHLLEHGFSLSQRTFQRDIEEIRRDLGIDIVYDRESNSYDLPGGQEDLDLVLHLLQRAVLGDILASDKAGLRKASNHVIMERRGLLKGIDHFTRLLDAMDRRRWVKLEYKRFQVDVVKEHKLRPALLKEYHGRWYVIGLSEDKKEPMAFGLDRIIGLHVQSKRFAPLEVDVKAAYENVIGVDRSAGKAERIVLRFTPEQGRYVKTLPIHPDQFIQRDDQKALELVLNLVPNYELQQEILAMGDTVKVLEPASLAREIREKHERAVKLYAGDKTAKSGKKTGRTR